MVRKSELCYGAKHNLCSGTSGVGIYEALCKCECHASERNEIAAELHRATHVFTLGAVMEDKAKRQEEPKPKQKKFWFGSPHKFCQICGSKLVTTFVDGRTQQGPWAIMCPICHRNHGVGLGTGKGQKYDVKTQEKLEG